ncbi:motility associated factor glycosyltransferase family protein [Lysinibacillus sp. F5]|uniref:motility associated factor glycosyltransferase family protein n=1 Tax=Lysinibacillus sp. F5 TaxID=1700846 RepID=UPI0007386B8E|nr:6-hydroxymethylpterin diphosphokinase MptE-like protein [Lysinibacillus sp. F5]KUF35304.1 hypothetical protein AK833_07485 [Lysinibacillus sp. F5]
MKWEIFKAKNNELTLELNDISIYSKYSPIKNASYWINQELDSNANHYILIGLGLGYHLKALLDSVPDKQITVYFFEEEEYKIFIKHNTGWWQKENVSFVTDLEEISNVSNIQILVPNVWIKAIGFEHRLHDFLETIRLKQVSYKRVATTMHENFYSNIELNDLSIEKNSIKRIACLVASGPSLNETIHWLKNIEHQVDIFVVGSALKVLEYYEIVPKGVVHADPSPKNINQFQDTKFKGELYYLSTANNLVVKNHMGPRYILLQEGYPLSEKYGNAKKIPLIQTGGSVGTVAFSLIEALGYGNVILFGQDLGFFDNETHITQSTSNQIVFTDRLRKVEANDGSYINTNAGLIAFLNWYNYSCKDTSMKVYNTSKKGAKIENVPLITEQQLYNLIK